MDDRIDLLADVMFDLLLGRQVEPADGLAALLLAAACWGRQHHASTERIHHLLSLALGRVEASMPPFSIEVVDPGDLNRELEKLAEKAA